MFLFPLATTTQVGILDTAARFRAVPVVSILLVHNAYTTGLPRLSCIHCIESWK